MSARAEIGMSSFMAVGNQVVSFEKPQRPWEQALWREGIAPETVRIEPSENYISVENHTEEVAAGIFLKMFEPFVPPDTRDQFELDTSGTKTMGEAIGALEAYKVPEAFIGAIPKNPKEFHEFSRQHPALVRVTAAAGLLAAMQAGAHFTAEAAFAAPPGAPQTDSNLFKDLINWLIQTPTGTVTAGGAFGVVWSFPGSIKIWAQTAQKDREDREGWGNHTLSQHEHDQLLEQGVIRIRNGVEVWVGRLSISSVLNIFKSGMLQEAVEWGMTVGLGNFFIGSLSDLLKTAHGLEEIPDIITRVIVAGYAVVHLGRQAVEHRTNL